MSIIFIMICLAVALALVIKLVILSKDVGDDMYESLNNHTTQGMIAVNINCF